MDQINMMIGQIRRMKVRQLTQQAINFGLVVASALDDLEVVDVGYIIYFIYYYYYC
jgi:hypothetical protein